MRKSLLLVGLMGSLLVPVLPEEASDLPDRDEPVVLETDPALQSRLEQALAQAPYRNLVRRRQLSVSLVDLTRRSNLRYAGIHDDVMRYAASLPKIAILLATFDQIDRGELLYTKELKQMMERMIRFSSNRDSTDLIRLIGFESIARTMQDPRFELYDSKRNGGLWVGKDYGGGLGRWKRDPLHHISHGATARQVARFLVMLDREQLISPWASREMKEIMSRPGINHKFVKGLSKRPGSVIYRKSGTWQRWHSDAALVEREGKKYAAVALLESDSGKNLFPQLILVLDDLIHQPERPPQKTD